MASRDSASANFAASIILIFGAIVVFLVIVWAFCFKMITPGYVGVVVDLFGDEKGVQQKELPVGMHWIAPWKQVYEFPIFEQNITWEGKDGFNFQTHEGMAVHCDLGITFHLDPEFVPVIFQRYRRGMDEISHLFIRNYVRDAVNTSASKMAIEDLYGSGKEEFFRQVQQHVSRDLSEMGVIISRVYIIGRFGFPERVIEALNSKIEATQRAQQRENELREAEAQAKKEVAKAEGQARCIIVEAESEAKRIFLKAEAEAKANSLLSKSVTPTLIEWQAVQAWNGQMPTVVGNSSLLMQLPGK